MSTVEKVNAGGLQAFDHILSHATKVTNGSGLIFLSGQTPLMNEDGVVPGTLEEHTTQCLVKLGKVLEAANSSWDKVVKINVFLSESSEVNKGTFQEKFKAMNTAYNKFLQEVLTAVPGKTETPKPARSCIQAYGLPGGVDVEIEAIATT
ncbi:Endoribonuclease L-PSP [Mycena maculata]|uniref:Endoribonuclease L-PSP n=1 Tax=Mycena maculata TaxID=230809 RepID=A0AAD7KE50_9AGAR|nr:Endoribonuclease L-PSP [Mycena maculata]